MKKTIFLVLIIAVLLLATTTMADENGIPFWLQTIANKMDEIKTAIQGLTLNSVVNVYPNYTPNVTVNNEVPVPSVEVTNEVQTPTVNVENNVPVPEVNNQITVTPSGSMVISLKCGWRDINKNVLSCTPPTCPEGFTDLGTGNVPTATDSGGAYGYSERWCAK